MGSNPTGVSCCQSCEQSLKFQEKKKRTLTKHSGRTRERNTSNVRGLLREVIFDLERDIHLCKLLRIRASTSRRNEVLHLFTVYCRIYLKFGVGQTCSHQGHLRSSNSGFDAKASFSLGCLRAIEMRFPWPTMHHLRGRDLDGREVSRAKIAHTRQLDCARRRNAFFGTSVTLAPCHSP